MGRPLFDLEQRSELFDRTAYDAYAERGESEYRNMELNTVLRADRLSDHRHFANLFRLYLHTVTYNLLVRNRPGGRCRTHAQRGGHVSAAESQRLGPTDCVLSCAA